MSRDLIALHATEIDKNSMVYDLATVWKVQLTFGLM